MGFARGSETVESYRKLFIGAGNFNVHGVNLSNEKLSELYGREVTGDKQFVSEVDVNGVKTNRARINITLSTEVDGTKQFFTAQYNVTNAPRLGSNSGKVQIIDDYGRTAWATQDEFDAKAIPMYSNGSPANISAGYRAAYVGEEFLTEFFKIFMVIPNVTKFDKDGRPVGLIDNPKDAEARFAHIDDWFKGDFSELNEMISWWPNNKVRLLAGVRKDDQNRLWQDFFINYPMRPSNHNFAKVMKEVDDAKNNGMYANTEFEFCELKEYVEKPTIIQPNSGLAAPSNPWFNQAKK